MIDIVDEIPVHHASISSLHRAAFGGACEAMLVDRLRLDELVVASLVALDDDELVGHILFSALKVDVDGRAVRAVALAPMAVQPARQKQGIGARLIAKGLAVVRERHCEAVIVLGHKGYYPRFGFSSLLGRKLASPFQSEAFMALELVPGALRGDAGKVTYPPAFGVG
jgi:putative acetyltransferase